jgi:two-component system response regulator RegX3
VNYGVNSITAGASSDVHLRDTLARGCPDRFVRVHAVEPVPGSATYRPSPTSGLVPLVPRVLVVSPEGGRSPLVESLRDQGLAVLVSPDDAVVAQVESGAVDLVLLHTDGTRARAELSLLRRTSAVPVVVVLREARASLEGFLEAGADDCVAGGVARTELAARIRAVLRRRQRPATGEVLRAGEFVIDLARHVFLHAGKVVHLPPKEFGLLELLVRRDGRVVSREEALHLVWGADKEHGDPTTVDVHVKRLRAKVEVDPANPLHLLTVRGLGYRFEQ